MNARIRLLLGCLLLTNTLTVYSQCVSISYDTLFTGLGNATTELTFPKFDPSLGTLQSIKIESQITLLYQYQLENHDINAINYYIYVNRNDRLEGAALLNPLFYNYSRFYGPIYLAPWDGLFGMGADYKADGPFYVMNKTNLSNVIYNTADFMGPGIVNFTYNTVSSSYATGSFNNYLISTGSDTVRVKLTYNYCKSSSLKADLYYFRVQQKEDQLAELIWKVDNEETGRTYDIESSVDGKTYAPVGQVMAAPDPLQRGSYGFSCNLQPYRYNKMVMFRIKQTNADGMIKYSNVLILDLKTSTLPYLRIYPNPITSYAQIRVEEDRYSTWQVELFSLRGERVRQENFTSTRAFQLRDLDQLPKGMYILKLTNKDTRKTYQEKILLQ